MAAAQGARSLLANPPGLSPGCETSTQSRERRRVALACREMGSFFVDELKGDISALASNMEMILCGLSLLLGKDWQDNNDSFQNVEHKPELFDISSVIDDNDYATASCGIQPEVELSPERSDIANQVLEGDVCNRTLRYDDSPQQHDTMSGIWEPIPISFVARTNLAAESDGSANMVCFRQDGIATARETVDTLADNTTRAATSIQAFMRGCQARKLVALRRVFDESSAALLFNIQHDLQELCKHLS